jgi:hypothetical protein
MERVKVVIEQLSFPLGGPVKATADFFVSEIVVEAHAAETYEVEVTKRDDLRRGYRVFMANGKRKEVPQKRQEGETL